MPTQIVKRDGTTVPFNETKISTAIEKALASVGMKSDRLMNLVTHDVLTALKEHEGTPTVEQVQDIVERMLTKRGLYAAAKSFILYRAQHEKMRNGKELMMDISGLINAYRDQSDWRVHENANSGYSYSSLLKHVSSSVLAKYGLMELYPPEIARHHIDGDFHIHDLQCSIIPYCAGHSLRDLLLKGFKGTPDKNTAGPAKHFAPALQQAANFLATLQTEWAGAQAFSSFDTYMAPFIKKDKEYFAKRGFTDWGYPEVKQALQMFLYVINVASRWGESPFTNITMDLVCPPDMKDQPVIIGGEYVDGLHYGDCQEEMNMLNKAFIELMMAGDYEGKPFSFPIPTYNITSEFDWDSELSRELFALTGKYGIPYFQNFIGSDISPSDTRSMCCRLRIDLRELLRKTGALFGSGEKTGSIGVVTLNMPRLGYLHQGNEKTFFAALEQLMDDARDSLEIKRKVVERSLNSGLMPYSKEYIGSFDNHFSTIGLVGMNECCLNFMGVNIADPKGKDFAVRVLRFMRDRLSTYQEETKHLYNLEATPAEGTCYRLARADKKAYPDIITAGGDGEPYYTNSTHLPVGYTDDVFKALDHQEELQTIYTGGTVVHVFLGEGIQDPMQCMKLVRKIAETYKIPAFTITPTYSVCPEHGYIKGEHKRCPKCVEVEVSGEEIIKQLKEESK